MDDSGNQKHIERIKEALLDPSSYPEKVEYISLKETHISLIFLTGEYVYKVKKPVDFGFLDFTTKEKRQYFCEKEVLLNRRLAPEIYIGVANITSNKGKIGIEGDGEIIEYAVKMKQLPEDFLLSRLLKEGRVTENMVLNLAHMLSEFYKNAETDKRIQDFARPERIKQDTDENFYQTEKYIGKTLSRETFEFIKERTNHFLKREDIFIKRIKEEKIRDCHGDLRLEHIFFGERIVIFDCIEFNERFRYTDTAADIAFLSMDLDFNNREDLGRIFVEGYVKASGDEGLLSVLDFYRCYRAYVRGKVESFRLDDPLSDEEEKKTAWEKAERYFTLSYDYAKRF